MQQLFVRLLAIRHLPIWTRYTFTTLLVLAAFGARWVLADSLTSVPFLLFFPAIILAALLFDRGNGLYAVALSTILAVYFFIEPGGTFAITRPGDLLAVVMFVASGAVTAVMIEALHKALEELRVSNESLKMALAELRESEVQKDVLMRELSHRTKNDLALLAGLLHFQARDLPDPAAKNIFRAAMDRIRVIGNVHGRLTRRERALVVDAETFINELVADLRTAFIGERPVAILVKAESHPIAQGRAVAIGLIVNELVTNAIKHAFPDGRAGGVEVDFRRQNGEFCLTVADDGVGAKPESAPGSGRGLIGMLTRQLRGHLEAAPTANGTRFIVTFPVAES
jgi:two-component system, sensor histidine kinase PdtaS